MTEASCPSIWCVGNLIAAPPPPGLEWDLVGSWVWQDSEAAMNLMHAVIRAWREIAFAENSSGMPSLVDSSEPGEPIYAPSDSDSSEGSSAEAMAMEMIEELEEEQPWRQRQEDLARLGVERYTLSRHWPRCDACNRPTLNASRPCCDILLCRRCVRRGCHCFCTPMPRVAH